MSIVVTEENKSTLQRNYLVTVGDSDRHHYAKTSVLVDYMQDLAVKSINNFDPRFCWDTLCAKGLAWFLIKYRLEIYKYPMMDNLIDLRTENRGCSKFTAYRDFEAFDVETGDKFFKAITSWLIVNLKDKSLVNLQKDYPEFPVFEKREDDIVLFGKLKTLENPDSEKVFSVRYDDLDINNHVNNIVYLSWATETLDYDFRDSHKLKAVDVYFKHEAKLGDDVLSQVKYNREDLTTEHILKNAETNEELCVLKMEFTKI